MITFIISYRQENDYRKDNLIYILKYLNILNLGDIEIIVVEQDSKEIFNLEIPNVKKIFIKNDNIFNKGWGYNVGVKESKYDILFFNDSDVVMPKHCYIDAIKEIGEYDVVDPYRKIFYYDHIQTQNIKNFNHNIFNPFFIKSSLSGVISGGAFVIKKQIYLDVKGFDEDCFGYGYEDDIFDTKIKKLGYNIKYNWNNYAFHLYHPVNPSDEYFKNKENNYKIFQNYMNLDRNGILNKISNIKKIE